MRVGIQQVVGATGVLVRKSIETIQNGKVVFGVVNGLRRVRWCRPANTRCRHALRSSRELRKIRKLALGGAHGLEGLDGRHARPRLLEIDSRK